MDQYHPAQMLNIDSRYFNTLDIQGFSQMMKDPSCCYKFYWLEAIVHLISEGVTETTFNDLIDEMIMDAWYSVREFHIHLSALSADGTVKDGLERAVLKLAEVSDLPSNASKIEIANAIHDHEKELKPFKKQITNLVPYRALAGFFDDTVQWNSVARMIAYIQRMNEITLLPYTLGNSPKLKKEVYFSKDWRQMIRDNTVNILGWIQYEKVRWLQNQNPEVPGIVYKLAPMDEKMRKLDHVKKLWKEILEVKSIRDIFTGRELKEESYDIDHFIPWSFVMNDELWNLMPTDSGINSSKSDHLPGWNRFFHPFADNQYQMYELINSSESIHRQFEKCYKDNLHSIWAGQQLYRPGNTNIQFENILEKNMRPIYDSAERQGYGIWPKEEKIIDACMYQKQGSFH